MANIQELKLALGAGGRVNKYKVKFSVPSAVRVESDLQKVDVLCKATQFPGVTISPIEVFSQGRKLVIPGDTAYENTWTLTFYNTEDHALRRDMLSWMKAADDFQRNEHSGNPTALMGELGVSQLDSAGNVTATYTFHNVWVTGVDAVEVSDDTDGGIQEFAVNFAFTDWVVGDGEFSDPALGNKSTLNDIAG